MPSLCSRMMTAVEPAGNLQVHVPQDAALAAERMQTATLNMTDSPD
jgi:hypothetical protein